MDIDDGIEYGHVLITLGFLITLFGGAFSELIRVVSNSQFDLWYVPSMGCFMILAGIVAIGLLSSIKIRIYRQKSQ